MFLLTSLNLLLDGQRNDDNRFLSGGDGKSDPQGQLSSAAWEGWWQDDAV
jgi:hypothetical protein